MNSCLYRCDVMHARLEPKKNKFLYQIFMFSLDLDEIDQLQRTLRFFSWNRFNLFNFRESDHLGSNERPLKEDILAYARSQGAELSGGRVQLVTHLRTLGYSFNPVCFYFCFDKAGHPSGAVVEVENTYHEKKRYWLGPETYQDGAFRKRVTKYFYVSPFIDLDAEFDFKLTPPDKALAIYIDDWKEGHQILLSALTGRREPLTDARMLFNMIRFPFETLQVIFLIHWQAIVLKLKGLPHFRKADAPHLQQEVHHVYPHSRS